jgi:hypothetical protein
MRKNQLMSAIEALLLLKRTKSLKKKMLEFEVPDSFFNYWLNGTRLKSEENHQALSKS